MSNGKKKSSDSQVYTSTQSGDMSAAPTEPVCRNPDGTVTQCPNERRAALYNQGQSAFQVA